MSAFSYRTTSISRFIAQHTVALLLAAWASIAVAGPQDLTTAELQLLPRYCPDTMGFTQYGDASSNTSPRAGYWVSLMGKSFWHMHHYCTSRLNMNRAQKANVPQARRKALWENALDNYRYVISKSEPDFIMLPEVYTRMGEVELLLGVPDQANIAFAKARALKADYWPAYSRWAEFLMKHGNKPEALRIVTSGLQHSPGAKVLLEQFRILGGKPSDIPRMPVKNTPEVVDDAASPTPSVAPQAPDTAPVTDNSAQQEGR